MPGYDVDALTTQLAHHGLHARTLEPHACPHRIDRFVPGGNRDLAAAADLARQPADLDQPLVDLRHLQLEQGRNEQWIRAREYQPRATRGLIHLLEHRADRLALPEPLTRILLLPRDDGVGVPGLAQQQYQLASLDLLDFCADELAHPVDELVPDLLPLAFTDALDNALLGGHDRVASEIRELDRDLEHVSGLEVRIVPARFLEGDLTGGLFDLLDHLFEYDDLEFAGGLVDRDLRFHLGAETPGERRHDPISDEIVEIRVGQILVPREIPKRRDNLSSAHNPFYAKLWLRWQTISTAFTPAEDQVRPIDLVTGYLHHFPILEPKPNPLRPVLIPGVDDPQQLSRQTTAAIRELRRSLHRHFVTGKTLVIAPPDQGSLDPRGRHFEYVPLAYVRVLVQIGLELPANAGAVVHGDALPRFRSGPVDPQPEYGTCAGAGSLQLDELEIHRRDSCLQLRLEFLCTHNLIPIKKWGSSPHFPPRAPVPCPRHIRIKS